MMDNLSIPLWTTNKAVIVLFCEIKGAICFGIIEKWDSLYWRHRMCPWPYKEGKIIPWEPEVNYFSRWLQTTHHQLTRGHDWWPESWGSVTYPSALKMFDTHNSIGVVMVMPLSWQTHEEEVRSQYVQEVWGNSQRKFSKMVTKKSNLLYLR